MCVGNSTGNNYCWTCPRFLPFLVRFVLSACFRSNRFSKKDTFDFRSDSADILSSGAKFGLPVLIETVRSIVFSRSQLEFVNENSDIKNDSNEN